MTADNPFLVLTPRHFWLRKRVAEIVDALSHLEELEDWEHYREQASVLSGELAYAVNEWEKYYPD